MSIMKKRFHLIALSIFSGILISSILFKIKVDTTQTVDDQVTKIFEENKKRSLEIKTSYDKEGIKDSLHERQGAVSYDSPLNKIKYDSSVLNALWRIGTETKEKGTQVPVLFGSNPRCMLGDIDIIARDLKVNKKAERLIASVEPLLDKSPSFEHKSENVSLFELMSGYSIQLNILLKDTPVHAGIYICNDTKGTGICSDKRITDLAQLADKNFKQTAPTTTDPKDNIYYFAHIMIDKDNIQFFNTHFEDMQYETLVKSWNGFFPNQNDIIEIINRTKKLNKLINSSLPTSRDGKIFIELPRLDRTYC
jgi:hypothetical protein